MADLHMLRLQALGDVCEIFIAMHSRRRTIKDHGNFFQRVSPRLFEQEVTRNQHPSEQDIEDDVIVPPNIVQPDRVDERQHNQRAVNRQQLHRQSLRTNRIWQDLRGVAEQQRRVRNIVVEEENEDEGYHRESGRTVPACVEDSRACSQSDKRRQQPDSRPEEERPTTETIDREILSML